MTSPLQVVLPVVCAALHVSYGLAEVALAKASGPALEKRAAAGSTGAAAAIEQNSDEDRLLAAALLGTSFFGAAGVAVSAELAANAGVALVGSIAYVVALALVDAALPRVVTHTAALTLAGPAAHLLRVTQIGLFPVVAVISAWARVVSAAAGSTRTTALTRQEIVLLLDATGDVGIDPQEQDLLRRVFALPEKPVRDCMTALKEVDFVRSDVTLAEAAASVTKTGHTRLIVAEPGAVGAGGAAIVGVVHARDLLFARNDGAPVRTVMRHVRRVPGSRPVHEIVQEMRRFREVIVVIVDDEDRAVGIVTIEDLLEEVVGEIHDERDRTAPPAPER